MKQLVKRWCVCVFFKSPSALFVLQSELLTENSCVWSTCVSHREIKWQIQKWLDPIIKENKYK